MAIFRKDPGEPPKPKRNQSHENPPHDIKHIAHDGRAVPHCLNPTCSWRVCSCGQWAWMKWDYVLKWWRVTWHRM